MAQSRRDMERILRQQTAAMLYWALRGEWDEALLWNFERTKTFDILTNVFGVNLRRYAAREQWINQIIYDVEYDNG